MGANIKIQSDSKQFITEMKEVTNNLKLVSSNLDVSSEKAKLFGSETDKLKAQHAQLSNNLQQNTTLLGLQNKTVTALANDIQKYRDRNVDLAKSISSVEDRLKEQIKLNGEDSKETKALQKELDSLQKEYVSNEKAMSKAESSMNNYKIKVNETEKELLQTKNVLEEVGKKLKTVNLDEFADKMDKVSKKTGEMAKTMGKVSLGVGGAFLAIGKQAYDAEDYMTRLQAKMGTTREQTEYLTEAARNVYKDGWGESLEDVMDSLTTMNTYVVGTSDMTAEMTQEVLTYVAGIKDVFGASNEEIYKTAKVMESSGLSKNIYESLDIITRGFQSGGDYSGELLDSLREYAPQFKKLGLSADEALNYLITGAENGAFNLDKVGDAMKEFSIRAIDGSKTTQAGFKAIGLDADSMALSISRGGEESKIAFQKTLQGLADIKDPLAQNQAGVALFGTMWEDLGAGTVSSLANVKGGLGDVDGATQKLIDTMNTSPQAQFNASLRETKDSLTPLGTQLLDIATNVAPRFSDILEKVTGFLSNMSPETATAIIAIGGTVFALTGLLSIVSTVSAGIRELTLFMGILRTSTLAQTIVTNLMSAAQTALNFVMNMNPIMKVVTVVSLLVGAFILAYNKVDWFRNMVNDAFEGIKNTISSVWNLVKNFSFPKIKLPHFSVQGEFSLVPPRMPKIGVEWYKNGGIMTSPTMFGMNGNNAMIGGEAGAEAILPLQQLWNQMDKNFDRLSERLNVNNNNKPIYVTVVSELDGKQVGRGIAKYVDEEINYLKI